MLDQLIEALKGKACKKKVVATYKMTEPQKKLWKDYLTAREKSKVAENVADVSKKRFWNKVEGDNNDFIHNLRINDEDWTVEAVEEDCDSCDNNEE